MYHFILFDRMFSQSSNFYENNMILYLLSDPAKSGLESSAWVDGYDYQNKDKTLLLRKKSLFFFFVQCIIAKTM